MITGTAIQAKLEEIQHVDVETDMPYDDIGMWWYNISYYNKVVVVAWHTGAEEIGVSLITPDSEITSQSDETFPTIDEVVVRVKELLEV
jgi:hypothetical protein